MVRQKWAMVDPDTVESVDVVDEGSIDATGTFQRPRAVRLVGLAERRDGRGNSYRRHPAQVLYVAGTHPAQNISTQTRSWNGLTAKLVHTLPRACDDPARLEAEPGMTKPSASTRSDINAQGRLDGVVVGAARCSDTGWYRVIDA